MCKSKLREESLRSTRPTQVPISSPRERRFHTASPTGECPNYWQRERGGVVDGNKGLLLLLLFLFKKHGKKLYKAFDLKQGFL